MDKSPLGYGQACKVLQDVIWVRERLETEEDATAWRIHWITCVTLLRSVGLVAHKVDGRTHPNLASACEQIFKTWKTGEEHKIFRDFIERQRNLILKEYETGMSEGDIPVMVTTEDPDGNRSGYGFTLGENLYRPLKDCPWEGDDGRDVIDEAISWWKREISKMEKLVDEMS